MVEKLCSVRKKKRCTTLKTILAEGFRCRGAEQCHGKGGEAWHGKGRDNFCAETALTSGVPQLSNGRAEPCVACGMKICVPMHAPYGLSQGLAPFFCEGPRLKRFVGISSPPKTVLEMREKA